MSGSSNSGPSMLGGHVHYVKGVAEEAIGKLTGSEEWKRSGIQDKEAAMAEMRAADHGPDKDSMVPGKLESTLGRAVGCDGMIEHGEEKQRMQQEK